MKALPIRKKYKDNPYTLELINGSYYVLFRDSLNVPRTIEISKELFNLFNEFELNDIHELNQFSRHIEHKDLTDESIYNKSFEKPSSLDDLIIRKSTYEDLMNAINKLSNTQRRRIKMYYFDEMDEIEIAKIENTSHQAIHKSLVQAKEKLKDILNG